MPRSQDRVRTGTAPVSVLSYDTGYVSDVTGVETGEVTLTQQHFQDEVDINTIVRRFGISGSMPFGNLSPGVYGDFTGISDYDDAVARIDRIEEAFMRLPPEVRERFENNPSRLVAYANTLTDEALESEFSPAEPASEPEVEPPA